MATQTPTTVVKTGFTIHSNMSEIKAFFSEEGNFIIEQDDDTIIVPWQVIERFKRAVSSLHQVT